MRPSRRPAKTETVIENDLYRITFTNRGAQVKSWILKKFDNDAQNGPLDLVNPAAAEKYGYPLSLWTYDEDAAQATEFRALRCFTGRQANLPGHRHLRVRRSGSLRPQDLQLRQHLRREGRQPASPIRALPSPRCPRGLPDSATRPRPRSMPPRIVDLPVQQEHRAPAHPLRILFFSKCTDISGGKTIPGPFHWAGPTDQYFAAVFIPDDPASAAMVTLRNSMPVLRDPQKPESKETVNVDVLGAAVGNLHGATTERIFVGPKELEVLQKVPVPGVSGADNDLNGLVDFGWWGIIAKPLFVWLKWTYHHIVANWGWAIVLQTLIISLALLPLRITQMKSMLKMQRVAPQIKSIQEKYKKYSLRDPRKAAMNEEISALYKKEGVNPAGGCLPMLIQMPFLFASTTKCCRSPSTCATPTGSGSTTCPPPSRSLPPAHLDGGEQLITQRMTPQAGMDPAQQRMMTVMMPLMMGFIFFRLPAGLNLYYAASNLIIDRAAGRHEPHVAGPRNARDDGQAREEERQIAVSHQLSAFSLRL